jgi:hypothetical protein
MQPRRSEQVAGQQHPQVAGGARLGGEKPSAELQPGLAFAIVKVRRPVLCGTTLRLRCRVGHPPAPAHVRSQPDAAGPHAVRTGRLAVAGPASCHWQVLARDHPGPGAAARLRCRQRPLAPQRRLRWPRRAGASTAIDLVGFGASSQPAQRATARSTTASGRGRCRGFCEQVVQGPAVLVGNSLGRPGGRHLRRCSPGVGAGGGGGPPARCPTAADAHGGGRRGGPGGGGCSGWLVVALPAAAPGAAGAADRPPPCSISGCSQRLQRPVPRSTGNCGGVVAKPARRTSAPRGPAGR